MKSIVAILSLTVIACLTCPTLRAQADKSAIETALKDKENQWEAAVAKHDASVVESMVAEDYIGLSSKGKVQTRADMLETMKKETDTYTSTANESLDVHVFAPNLAVVSGSSKEVGKDKDGKAFTRSYRWVDTWMERNGKWQCVASGNMLLPEQK